MLMLENVEENGLGLRLQESIDIIPKISLTSRLQSWVII